jgi:putative salt-induced outer membrane protein
MKKMIMTGICLVAVSVLAEEKKAPVWDTSAGLGANLSRGNTESTLLDGSIVSETKQGQNEARLGIEANYGETETVQTNGTKKMDSNVQNARAFAEYRRLWSDRDYGYLNGELRNDEIAEIDHRLMVGPGVGRYFVSDEKQKLSGETGVVYIQEKVAGEEDDTMALRLAQRYSVKISDNGKVYESVEYLPSLEGFDDYLLNAEVGVEAMMNSRMGLRLAIQDKYDSTPAPNKKDNDLTLIGGLTVKL